LASIKGPAPFSAGAFLTSQSYFAQLASETFTQYAPLYQIPHAIFPKLKPWLLTIYDQFEREIYTSSPTSLLPGQIPLRSIALNLQSLAKWNKVCKALLSYSRFDPVHGSPR
jgi:hypothetical protein